MNAKEGIVLQIIHLTGAHVSTLETFDFDYRLDFPNG